MNSRIAVSAEAPRLGHAQQLAARLGLPVAAASGEEGWDYLLHLNQNGLALCAPGPGRPGPVRPEFGEAAVQRRRAGGGELLLKAIGGRRPSVVDATAGLGRDAFVLASHGCQVLMLERSPVVAALLEDAMTRARHAAGPEHQALLARMRLRCGDARELLEGLEEIPDAIYLDPMFPESGKRAQVKKEMQAFRALLGQTDDAGELLVCALDCARHRVVVKRARRSAPLPGRAPSHQLSGKAVRFDIYALRKYG